MESKPLSGKVALVTGATRGVGKGIALQLSEAGALVYITGRTLKSDDGNGSLEETEVEIRKRGGKCVPVQVDHENDLQVTKLFEQIDKEQNGQLDILVNNVFKAMDTILDVKGRPFWELDPNIWDEFNNAGLRNHYFCTVYAARLMVPRRRGLIVFISSIGGTRYMFNILYGISKAAIDRMAIDCGIELREHNVASISLVLGGVHTETLDKILDEGGDSTDWYVDPIGIHVDGELVKEMVRLAESPEFSGKVIVSLASNSNLMKYSSKAVIAADYAQKHHLRDIDNRVIPSFRQINYALLFLLPKPLRFLRNLIPDFIKTPNILIEAVHSKF